jgi:hypothetical protein
MLVFRATVTYYGDEGRIGPVVAEGVCDPLGSGKLVVP